MVYLNGTWDTAHNEKLRGCIEKDDITRETLGGVKYCGIYFNTPYSLKYMISILQSFQLIRYMYLTFHDKTLQGTCILLTILMTYIVFKCHNGVVICAGRSTVVIHV